MCGEHLSEAICVAVCVYQFCVAEYMGKWEPPLMLFKDKIVSPVLPRCPSYLEGPDWEGGGKRMA